MAKNKEHINLVFVGHVDHGKSTTVGRLLYDSGNVDEQSMRKLKEKAQEFRRQWTEVFDAPGREEWWMAYLKRAR